MILTSLLLLAAAPGAAPSPAVKQGVELWQAGDYERAVKAWTGPAEAGDADAQFNLGQAYKLGRGVRADMRQAESWYRKAAASGHDQAGAMLGLVMFQNGDRRGALPHIRKAAEAGDPRAQYVYGTALFNGDEVVKDWPRAYAMMTRAADAGLPQAKTSLTQMDSFIPLADRQAAKKVMPPARRVAGAAPRPVRPAPSPSATAEKAPAAKAEPKPAPKAAVTPAARPAAGWRVQLGAFSDASAARTAWIQVSGRLGGLQPSYVKAGAVTRLQAGPLASRAAAVQACAKSGGPCFPVAP